MCGITRTKLLRVGYGRTSQHNKGLLTKSSPVPLSTEYRTQNADATVVLFCRFCGDEEHRTGSRRPLDEPPDTTTAIDEDGVKTNTKASSV